MTEALWRLRFDWFKPPAVISRLRAAWFDLPLRSACGELAYRAYHASWPAGLLACCALLAEIYLL